MCTSLLIKRLNFAKMEFVNRVKISLKLKFFQEKSINIHCTHYQKQSTKVKQLQLTDFTHG